MHAGGGIRGAVARRARRRIFGDEDRPAITASERLLVRIAERHAALHPEVAFQFTFDEQDLAPIGEGATLCPVRIRRAAETCRRIFTGGSLELGACYCDGLIEAPPDRYIHFLLLLARAVFDPQMRRGLPLADQAWLIGAGWRGPWYSRGSADENINSHYSLCDWVDDETANRFYLAWLDERYHQYTCALWGPETATVEEAQEAKLVHYCRRLGLSGAAPSRSVLELGCGWGGFLFHAVEHHGVRARGITLSTAQGRHIREEARRRGLLDRIEVEVGDARAFTGRWDHVVAIGLLEHIEDLDALFARTAEALEPGGSVLFHAMFHEGRLYKPDPWLTRYIFPGGRVPGIDETIRLLKRRFAIVQREDLPPLSYPRTLEAWHDTFTAREDTLRSILRAGGCPQVDLAIRLFRHYLVLAEAGLTVDGIVSNIVCREPLPAARSVPATLPGDLLSWAGEARIVPEPEP